MFFLPVFFKFPLNSKWQFLFYLTFFLSYSCADLELFHGKIFSVWVFQQQPNFRQASNYKNVPKSTKHVWTWIKQESLITYQKLAFCNFWYIANSFLKKGKSTIYSVFNGPQVLSSLLRQISWLKSFVITHLEII